MGYLNVTCPECGMEDAYHNGVGYECPNCDHSWSDGLEFEEDDEEDDD